MIFRSVVSLSVFVLVVAIYAVSFENARGLVQWDAGACPAAAPGAGGAPPRASARDAYASILSDIRDAMNDPSTTSEAYARLLALKTTASGVAGVVTSSVDSLLANTA